MSFPDKKLYSIAPWLSVKDSLKALDFYTKAFRADIAYRLDLPDGVVARLSIQGAQFWIADESPEFANEEMKVQSGRGIRIILTVLDPDKVFEEAINAGAIAVFAIHEEHGWRVGRITDPFGHEWEIGREVPAT
jgi:PhnB protein